MRGHVLALVVAASCAGPPKATVANTVTVLASAEPRGTALAPEPQRPNDATPDVTLAEVDTRSLTPREKRDWSSYVSTMLAPCADTPVPIAQCVQEKRNCNRCLPAANLILKGVRNGSDRQSIEHSVRNRFDADRVWDVPVDGSPSKGPADAPVVIVEFADFECPHCQEEAPKLEQLCEVHANTVRFVFKFMPLARHPHAEPAARAAIAAGMQGKFWQMHQKLFANPDHLEQSDFDAYARALGLDVPKFRAQMRSKEADERLASDRKLADALMVAGTPTFYINRRLYEPVQTLQEWVDLELRLSGPLHP